ncbi:cytochrome C oxidase subunit IV family protein [Roseimicrobium sp. ORNL1]|uniref:cytochrome C oxidase subunit IV family protein n=1 Tax=Roseimicrobium sp. ORNL1 TaxID=2711231 RepID=UPI0013E1D4F8|nr:cytochrome C oxidase subunit IV family protein [Roseimicrobium sp. ORNL1]QIF00846.1 cytochrome C oxidase subunit IV family protein [Roseimicrobium sp. ORNL1]
MAHDHHDHDSPEAIKKASAQIWWVGLILVIGTGITVWAREWDMGTRSKNIALGMFIATVKAGCVGLIFMHLKNERGLIYKFLFFTVIFAIGLFVLTYLAWADPLHSHIIPAVEH